MDFKSINPYNGAVLATYTSLTKEALKEKLDHAKIAFEKWRGVELSARCQLMRNAAEVLRTEVETYATMISKEMGKPIMEARAEVKKCALACDYYAENAPAFLADEVIKTDASQSMVRHEPLGTIFAVMPWNFPFWQVFRFAAPTLVAGNTAVLKHASNVFGCAMLIEEVFSKAGFPKDVFQTIIVTHDDTEDIIAHDAIKAVTLTGSEGAGRAVASLAGKYLKKSLLELGGSNAFIVLADADMDATITTAAAARMRNCGQSCIAAKRFLIEAPVYDEFVEKLKTEVAKLVAGDPMEEGTQLGTLARKDLADELDAQVKKSIAAGATLILGGKQDSCFYEPTLLANVQPGMAAFDEETFGPLAAITKVDSFEEAIQLAELSPFGLGVTVCTKNIERALAHSHRFSDGAFFVNELVMSDPRLPFGGTKKSGYGRELSKDGMMEFVNRQTIYVK